MKTIKNSAQQTTAAALLIMALLIMVLVLGATHSSQALADSHKRTRAEAVEIAKQRSNNGRVLSVKKRVNKKGVSVFAVKIITDGRVKVYSIREIPN